MRREKEREREREREGVEEEREREREREGVEELKLNVSCYSQEIIRANGPVNWYEEF